MPKSKGKIPRITFRAVQPVNLSDENWRTIEEAYGQSISQEIRTQISAATTQFLQFAVAEDTGLMNDAVKRVRRFRGRAKSLIDAIGLASRIDATKGRPSEDAIREYVDEELALIYALLNYDQPLPIGKHDYVGGISVELTRFVRVCDEMLNFSPQYYYWPDGGAWERWIRELTGILEAHQLATGVRKDTDKTKSDRASPFVELVRTLQTFVPLAHIRAEHSTGALATAINKARNESKPFVAPKKARARKTGRNLDSRSP